MRKKTIIAALTLLPMTGFAKVADFNAMISENMKEQNQLHGEMKNNVNEAREIVQSDELRKRVVLMEESSKSYNAPTNKALLSYNKEKKQRALSDKKQFQRLANEINLSEE